ncbi:MAG: NlpC/P60 family protein [Vagococcus sp.]|nr:NlpC/P60 family protein [Vagococcus sp.]
MKKRILSVVLVSSIALGSVMAPTVALATDLDQKIEKSNNKIKELSSKEASAAAELEAVKANIAKIQEKSAKLQSEQQSLDKEVNTLASEIEVLNEKIAKRDAAIKEQARSTQTEGMGNNLVEAVFSAETVSEAVTRVAAATKLVSASNDLLKQQENDKKSVEQKKNETEQKLEQITENAIALEAQQGQLYDQELAQQILVATVSAERATEEGKKAEFIKEKEELEAKRKEEARLVAEAKVQAEQAATVATTENTTAPSQTQETAATENQTQAPQTSTEQPAAPAPSQPAPAPTPAPSNASGAAIVAEAQKHFGKPYTQEAGRRMGPNSFDCSGLTNYVYRQVTGRDIGGWTVPQEAAGVQIPVSQAQPGDLLFWGARGATYHVAISTGGSGYIHAPTYGQTVTSASISPYFAPSFAVRVL